MTRLAGPFVYVTEVDVSVDDGPGINEREFVRALLERHADEVEVVLPSPVRPQTFYDDRIHYVAAHRGTAGGYARYLVSATRRIRRLARNRRPAALVFRPGGTPIVPLLARRAGPPVIFKKLGLYAIFGEGSARSPVKNAVSRAMLPLYREMIRTAVAADVESHAYPPWLQERFGVDREKLRVIPNGVNLERFRPLPRDEARATTGLEGFERVIGYVGALARIRHVDLLLSAFAAMRSHGKAGLILVGGGPDAEALRNQAAALGVANRVRFAGVVPYEDVPRWMSAFDIAVDPTAVQMRVSGGVRLGSYSQKIPQYLGCGASVVAWRCDDTRFLDEENVGATVPCGAVDGMKGAMEALLVNAAEKEASRRKARRVAMSRFDARELATLRVEWWHELTAHPSKT